MPTPTAAEAERYIRQNVPAATHTLGGTPDETTVENILAAGNLETRHFHRNEHFHTIMRAWDDKPFNQYMERFSSGLHEKVVAVMLRAAAHHDIVYHHVDYGFTSSVEKLTAPFITLKKNDAGADEIWIKNFDQAMQHPIFRQAWTLFGLDPKKPLNPYGGQNEFLSALYVGLQAQKEKIPEKYILAEMMMIEGTVPFLARDRFWKDEENKPSLETRFRAANALLDEDKRLDDKEIKAFLAGAVQLVNVDVYGFRDTFEGFFAGTRQLLHEPAFDIKDPASFIGKLTKNIGFYRAKLENSQKGIGTIFHGIEDFPPALTLDEWERKGRANLEKSIAHLEALQCAVGLVSAIHVQQEPKQQLRFKLDEVLAGSGRLLQINKTSKNVNLLELAKETPVARIAATLYTEMESTSLAALAKKIREQGVAPVIASDGKVNEAETKQKLDNLFDVVPPPLLQSIRTAMGYAHIPTTAEMRAASFSSHL